MRQKEGTSKMEKNGTGIHGPKLYYKTKAGIIMQTIQSCYKHMQDLILSTNC